MVLGYISNETRRFYTYVSNRVEKIRSVTSPAQWRYISTEFNPADVATRCNSVGLLENVRRWLQPPHDAFHIDVEAASNQSYPLICPNDDMEIRASVLKTKTKSATPLSTRFKKFSSWTSLVRAFSLLRHVGKSFHSSSDTCKGWHNCSQHRSVENLKTTETFILITVQQEAYTEEVNSLSCGRPISTSSALHPLCPYLDSDGLLRVGGRLSKAEQTLGVDAVHPVILPK
ncbi:Gag-pol fusion polyprotein [Elysia marginata]|uniref:Gag-pol fusion polyprotein n=1 Tax=Elysia marginata TaxID=1093978 RepID=A0AAV4HMB2_9GAST|nr:Gag-pol fusion polyprotein [Elysia marginata]